MVLYRYTLIRILQWHIVWICIYKYICTYEQSVLNEFMVIFVVFNESESRDEYGYSSKIYDQARTNELKQNGSIK